MRHQRTNVLKTFSFCSNNNSNSCCWLIQNMPLQKPLATSKDDYLKKDGIIFLPRRETAMQIVTNVNLFAV